MKNWFRVLLLAGALTVSSFVIAEADPWYTNTCYISCDGTQYPVQANSSWECCTRTYLCPDNSSPNAVVWSGGPGEFPTLCGPYAD
jgi:hypothetical protein